MRLLQSKIVFRYGCRYSCGRNKRQSKTFRFRSRNKQFFLTLWSWFHKAHWFYLVFSAFPNFLTKFNCNGSLWITQYNNLCEYTAIVVFASCLNFPNFVLSSVSPQGCFIKIFKAISIYKIFSWTFLQIIFTKLLHAIQVTSDWEVELILESKCLAIFESGTLFPLFFFFFSFFRQLGGS